MLKSINRLLVPVKSNGVLNGHVRQPVRPGGLVNNADVTFPHTTAKAPIPAMILAGPLYRGEGFFMPLLFLSTIFFVGPAWSFSSLTAWTATVNLNKLRPFLNFSTPAHVERTR